MKHAWELFWLPLVQMTLASQLNLPLFYPPSSLDAFSVNEEDSELPSQNAPLQTARTNLALVGSILPKDLNIAH